MSTRWVPNQHGAWAMLAGPLLVGILAGGAAWVHLPLTVLWFLGYFAFFAAARWLKSRRRRRYLGPVVVYALACFPQPSSCWSCSRGSCAGCPCSHPRCSSG
jgi:hypothetical protein